MILLIAMIGAIVLTLQHRTGVRRQAIADQIARTPATGMSLVQIKSGEAERMTLLRQGYGGFALVSAPVAGPVLRSSARSAGG